jgi:hypothetical protein
MVCCDRPLARPKELESLFKRFGLVEDDPLVIIEDGQVTDTQAWQTVSRFHLDDSALGVVHLSVCLEGDDSTKASDLTRELRRFGFNHRSCGCAESSMSAGAVTRALVHNGTAQSLEPCRPVRRSP